MITDTELTDPIVGIETAFAFHQAGQFDQARAMYYQILHHNPDDYNALQLLGALALNDGDCRVAADLIGRAVSIVDSDPSAFNNLGEACRGLGRLEEAEQCFRRALSLNCSYAIAYNNLAVVLHLLKRSHEAEEACRNALNCSPSYAEALNNLGIILADLNKTDEAETAYWKAIDIKSDYVAPYVNLGILFKNLGRCKKSEWAYKMALRFNPNADDVIYNLSILELLQGKLRQGFEHYEKRIEKRSILFDAPLECPSWQGEKLNGKSLLIVTEQGAGDSLMMMRYLRILKKSKYPEKLGIHCEFSLERVFLTFPEVDMVFPKSEQPPFKQFDYHCSMMSLPYLLKTTLSSIPNEVPYLTVPHSMTMKWHNFMSIRPGFKVGLAWAGNKALDADAKRSIPLKMFSPLLDVSGVHLFSLQKNDDFAQLQELSWDVVDVMDECVDYMDTASLMSHLNLVISVDTSVVHLAGAMGKPVWLLNRHESEWRWMFDRSDSPWYPTLRIFRQEAALDWSQVVKIVRDELVRIMV